ncbi:MAG: AmmeMemoRadiSam system protein A [Planctomycetes bacterium]|nr:AmmeMemoRadiSam system protein A [Planctomycetota bacterium]
MLTPEEKAALLALAWQSVRHVVAGAPPAAAPTAPTALSPALQAARGAFVTLKAGEDLRGCLGLVQPVRPLWEAVRDMAAAAAREDPRFDPITPAELPALRLEISALTPMEPVAEPSTIRPGIDGLYIRRGGASGLLLPQVATEQGWDTATFLRHVCRKAGLPDDAWRQGAELFRFTAEVFG